MNGTNPICDVMLHLGFSQLRDGLYEDAYETFSAALVLDSSDSRVIKGRELASARLGKSV